MATPIGTLGTIPALTVGGRVFTDLTNLIILYGTVTTSGHYSTLRKANGTSGYQVTTGKTYTINAVSSVTNGAGGVWNLGYGNTDVGLDSASAPTTPIYVAGGTIGIISQGVAASSAGSQVFTQPGLDFQVLSQKYAVLFSNATNLTVQTFGYET